LSFTHLGEHAIDGIQCLQHHIHQFGVDLPLTLSQDVEYILGDMTAGDQGIQLQKAGTTLDGMKTTKNGIEQIGIARAVFQIHQLLRQQLENFPSLYQKVLENFFIRIKAHSTLPCPSDNNTNGVTSL